MKAKEGTAPELPSSLLLVISVILTILVALFLTFSDELQTRIPSPIRPTALAQIGFTATPAPPQPTISPTSATTPGNLTVTPTATSPSIIAELSCNNAPADWIPIVTGPQDTLYSLSIQYGATIGEIVQANCLESRTIFSGMTIYLPPTPPARTPCGPPQWWVTYIVRPGDTLGSLARRHGTTVFAIMQANCLSDTRIFAGRSLFLPPLPATVPPPPTLIPPTNTPIATPTMTPTGLPSPMPSATTDGTIAPTATSTPSAGTAVPTSTPTITGTPPATNTPLPTISGTPPQTSTATAAPTTGPTETAVPSTTPSAAPPTNTPQPSSTPQPTATEPPPPSSTPEP